MKIDQTLITVSSSSISYQVETFKDCDGGVCIPDLSVNVASVSFT